MVHTVVVQRQRQFFDAVSLCCGELASLDHLVDDYVAAVAHTVLVAQRVVVARVLEHADEHRRLLDLEVSRLLAEIHVGGSLDADRVVEEVKPVEVHIDDFLLGVEPLELYGYHPLDRLLQRTLEDVGRGLRIELLGKLLGYCRAAARRLVAHQYGLDDRAGERAEVDARMALKPHVLGGYKRIDDMGRHVLVVAVCAVALPLEVAAHLGRAVAGVDDRGELVMRVLKLLDRRHIAYHAVVDEQQQRGDDEAHAEERDPHPAYDVLLDCALLLLAGVLVAVAAISGRGFYVENLH